MHYLVFLLVGPWAVRILGPYSNVAVDAIGLETDFTLETNKKLLNAICNPEFHFLDLEFQTIEIQSFWAKSKIFHRPFSL